MKNLTTIDIEIADRKYQFMCDPESPLGHVKEALFQLMKRVGKVEDDLLMQQAAAQKEAEVEEVKEDADGSDQ